MVKVHNELWILCYKCLFHLDFIENVNKMCLNQNSTLCISFGKKEKYYEKYEEINNKIATQFDRGTTLFEVEGGYTRNRGECTGCKEDTESNVFCWREDPAYIYRLR